MHLVLISGAEATCKSTIGKKIASQLGYVYQSKDAIKENLYDIEDRNTWDFRWYESRAKQAFFLDIQSLIDRNVDSVIESNFVGEDRSRLAALITPKIQLSEVHCYTNGLSSFKRVVKRNESKERHHGHHDRRWYPKILFQSVMHSMGVNIGAHNPINISNKVFCIDTSDFSKINYEEVIQFIASAHTESS